MDFCNRKVIGVTAAQIPTFPANAERILSFPRVWYYNVTSTTACLSANARIVWTASSACSRALAASAASCSALARRQ